MAFKRNNNVIDSPGNNFATLNPLFNGYNSWGNYASKNGSLQIEGSQMAQSSLTIPEDGRSYYIEAYIDHTKNDGI